MTMRIILFLLIVWAIPAKAEDSALQSMQTGHASKGWEGVGRLDIMGKGFCTAALISDQLILTAAHCLYDIDGSAISTDRFVFEAGLRNGRSEASRGITRVLAHPDYDPMGSNQDPAEIAHDIAILALGQPVRNGRIKPYPIATEPRAGDEIGIVSYARERAEAPSLQEVCNVMGQQTGVILMSCSIDFGSSGAPVFKLENGQAHIVSVVSAMANVNGTKIALGTSLTQPLAQLLEVFESTPNSQSGIIQGGQRQDTGAKFLRP